MVRTILYISMLLSMFIPAAIFSMEKNTTIRRRHKIKRSVSCPDLSTLRYANRSIGNSNNLQQTLTKKKPEYLNNTVAQHQINDIYFSRKFIVCVGLSSIALHCFFNNCYYLLSLFNDYFIEK